MTDEFIAELKAEEGDQFRASDWPLRLDLAIQTALGRDEELASALTLCHWENRAGRQTAVEYAQSTYPYQRLFLQVATRLAPE